MFNTESIISYGGLSLLFLIIYSHTGLFFCFFLPGGALMFTLGVLIATGSVHYSLLEVIGLLTLATALGNLTGYWFGKKTGPLLYKRNDSGFFRKQYLKTAGDFYEKYGAMALMVGVFLPLVRTFSPIVSGIILMNFKRFFVFTTIGAVAYVIAFVCAGYIIGSMPFLRPWLTYLVTAIILIVTVPIVVRII